MPTPSTTDLVITSLGDELADVRAGYHDALDTGETYRALAQLALHRLAELTQTIKRQTDALAALRQELRRYTSSQVGRECGVTA